jgi:flagella synthesis protein FlgN
MTPATIQTVHQLLENSIRITDELLSLLEQERSHLQQRNHNAIPPLLEQKQQLMSQLEQGAELRQQWLADTPQQTDQTQEELWCTLLTELGGPTLSTLWDAFKDKLVACQQGNEVNGKMIGRGQQSIRQLLTLLKGQVETPKLYNQAGNTQSHSLSQTVVKA